MEDKEGNIWIISATALMCLDTQTEKVNSYPDFTSSDIIETQNGIIWSTSFDGSLGYPLRGLQREAIRLVTHRGDGVNLWLPWCTASALDPLFRMEDAYGAIGIDNIVGRNSKRSFKKLDESKYVKQLGLVRLPEGKTY